jgi:tetratricopeptide (TPR) repeat protein
VLAATATLATQRDQPAEALASIRAILALAADDPDATPELRAVDQYNLSVALGNSGAHADAARAAQRAVELAEAALGPDHPDVGTYLAQLGSLKQLVSELDPADAALERGLAILERWYGPDDPHLDRALGGLGALRLRQGRSAEASELWQRRLAIARAANPTDVPAIQSDLATAMIESGDLAGAAQASGEALAMLEQQYGATSPALVNALNVVGYVARAQGRIDEALRHFRRALALIEPGYGALHPATINLRIELARTLVLAGQPAAARATLERALDEARRNELDPQLVVEGCLVIADVDLAQLRRADAARRVAIAIAAADAAAVPALIAMVAAWRAAHPR